jgi:AmiR/NasT family two-component response regulator
LSVGVIRDGTVAITGYGQSEARERARKSGIEHYLVKPIEASELERLLM